MGNSDQETDSQNAAPPQLDQDFFQSNLAALRQIAPHVAHALDHHAPQSNLVRNALGEWDVEFRGEFLYGAQGRKRNEFDIEEIRAGRGARLFINPIASSALEYFSQRLLYKTMRRATDAGMVFYEKPVNQKAYHLLSFGFGLGHHMPALLELTTPFSVCIVEPNLDFLFHSLFVFDWSVLVDITKRCGRDAVSICTAQTAEAMGKDVRSHCRGVSPVSVDGTVLFSAYANEQMMAGAAAVLRDAYLISIGLGFVHDEMEMARAAYMNLRDGNFKLFRQGDKRLNCPVFVVGSGPSIDADIEAIKAYQDKAVIISCGTAGRVLVANGIQPDFQFILENGTNPYLALAGAHEQFGFEKAVLVASNTVDPRLKTLFKTSVFFLRQAICSYAMFYMGPEFQLANPGPTVVNTGVSAALAMGFREIYLFGVDLGTRQKGRHHSRHSVYRHEDDQKEGVKGAFDYTDDYPIVDVGNFGGLVHTDLIMSWTRDTLVQSISPLGAQCRVYNCSDGLQITGTIPMSSGGIKLKSKAEDKDKAVQAALASFPDGSREAVDRLWNRANWPTAICTLVDKIIDLVTDLPENPAELMHKAKNLLLVDSVRMPDVPEFFVRGSILISIMTAGYYWNRIADPEMVKVYRDIVREELLDVLTLIEQQTHWFFDHIEEFESYEDLEAQAREWGNE